MIIIVYIPKNFISFLPHKWADGKLKKGTLVLKQLAKAEVRIQESEFRIKYFGLRIADFGFKKHKTKILESINFLIRIPKSKIRNVCTPLPPGKLSPPLKNFTELYDIVGRGFFNVSYVITGEDTHEIYNCLFFCSACLFGRYYRYR
ncbi:MAG: hypothetical protein R3339_05305, partial [Thermodesulfobacteriota bacterium]|nr:hypothetical protein [Thermodesulfobacteriota bacterium]